MIANKPILDETIILKVGEHKGYEIQPLSIDGYFLFSVVTLQERDANDDVIVIVYDEKNYNLFVANKTAIKAGAAPSLLTKSIRLLNGKSYWCTMFFKPSDQEKYYFVVDNSHSTQTKKTVQVKIYWRSEHSEFFTYLKNSLHSYDWDDLWQIYENTLILKERGDYASTCDNLRKIIVILWTRVCEKVSKTKIEVPEGKSVNLKPLEDIFNKMGVPNYVVSFITRSWSLVSELAHIEKNDGKQPNLENTNLAISTSLSIIGFLLSVLEKKNQS